MERQSPPLTPAFNGKKNDSRGGCRYTGY